MLAPCVLLTGADTFVGSHILDHLTSYNIPVQAIIFSSREAKRLRQKYSNIDETQLAFITAPDKSLSQLLFTSLGKGNIHFNTVIHAADIDHSFPGKEEITTSSDFINVVAGIRVDLLKSMSAYTPSIRRVIFTNTLSTFLNWAEHDSSNSIASSIGQSGSEDLYSICKYSQERVDDILCRFIEENRPPFDLVSLTAPFVFGPGEKSLKEEESMVLDEGNSISNSVLLRDIGRVLDLSCQLRGYVDVRDFALAHVQATIIASAGKHRFMICAGHFSQDIVYSVLKRYIADNIHQIDYVQGTLLPSQADTAPVAAILGLIRYLTAEETLISFLRSRERFISFP